MAGFLSDEGLQIIIENGLLHLPGFIGAAVGLFQSNTTIDIDTVFADLTPADFPGYAEPELGMPVGAILSGHIQIEPFSPASFIAGVITSPQTIYGYYVKVDDAPTLLWSENFAVPIVVSTTGQVLIVVPSFDFADRSITIP